MTAQKRDTVQIASQWKLIWWRFRRHKLATIGLIVTLAFYLVAAFAEFLAPYTSQHLEPDYIYAPPQVLKVVDTSGDGWDWDLYVMAIRSSRTPIRWR